MSENEYRPNALENLKLPTPEVKPRPIMAETRNVAILTALENFLHYAYIPKKKVIPYAKMLGFAVELDDVVSWNKIMLNLAAETAREGYRGKQAVDVLIAEKQAKQRLDAFGKLAGMGPKPKEQEAPDGS